MTTPMNTGEIAAAIRTFLNEDNDAQNFPKFVAIWNQTLPLLRQALAALEAPPPPCAGIAFSPYGAEHCPGCRGALRDADTATGDVLSKEDRRSVNDLREKQYNVVMGTYLRRALAIIDRLAPPMGTPKAPEVKKPHRCPSCIVDD